MRLLNDALINKDGKFNMWDHTIGLCYRGSKAHGTYIPNSNPNSIDDIDVLGIFLPPKEIMFGLGQYEQFEKFYEYWDILIYDFKKALRLLIKSNPNIVQMLWTPEDLFIINKPEFKILRENRELFVSKQLYHSFCGYSQGQLHKMESMAYKGYMGEKRKQLVDKFGYDCKNAQHLIRLLRQGIEFLKTGELIVERPDAAELIQIKTGQWTIEKVKREANKLFADMEDAYAKSTLPDKPDVAVIDKLCQGILFDYYCKA